MFDYIYGRWYQATCVCTNVVCKRIFLFTPEHARVTELRDGKVSRSIFLRVNSLSSTHNTIVYADPMLDPLRVLHIRNNYMVARHENQLVLLTREEECSLTDELTGLIHDMSKRGGGDFCTKLITCFMCKLRCK